MCSFESSGVVTGKMSVILLCSVCMAENSSDITDWASGQTILSSQGAMYGHLTQQQTNSVSTEVQYVTLHGLNIDLNERQWVCEVDKMI